MITIKSSTGKKAVIIKATATGSVIAQYVQYNAADETQQVLKQKTYATEKGAIKWANKQLS